VILEYFQCCYGKKKDYRYKYLAFLGWKKYIRLRKYGKILFVIRMKFEEEYYYRKLKVFLDHWKTVSSESAIVSYVKALWLGFKCRFLVRATSWKYQYLLWYKRQIPKIIYLRKKYCKRRIFLTLQIYARQQREFYNRSLVSYKFQLVIKLLWRKLQLKKKHTRLILFRTKHYKHRIQKRFLNLLKQLHRRKKYIQSVKVDSILVIYNAFMKRLKSLSMQHAAKVAATQHYHRSLKWKYLVKHLIPMVSKRQNTSISYNLQILSTKKKFWMLWKQAFQGHVKANNNHQKRVTTVAKAKFRSWYNRYSLGKKSWRKCEFHHMAYLKAIYWCIWTRRINGKKFQNKRWISLYKRLFPGEKKIRDISRGRYERNEPTNIGTSKSLLRLKSSNEYNFYAKLIREHKNRFTFGLEIRYSFSSWKSFVHRRKYYRIKKIDASKLFHRRNMDRCRYYLYIWLTFLVKFRSRKKLLRKYSASYLKERLLFAFLRLLSFKKRKKRVRTILRKLLPTVFYAKYFHNKCSRVFWKLREKIKRKRMKQFNVIAIFNNPQQRIKSMRIIRKLRIKMQHFLEALKLLLYHKKHPQKKYQRKVILKKEFNFLKFQVLRWHNFIQKLKVKRMINYYTLIQYQNQKRVRTLRHWLLWMKMTKRFHLIRKRFYLFPIFQNWLKCTANQFQHRRIVNAVQYRINTRIKRQFLILWKIFSQINRQSTKSFLIVQRRHLRFVKQRYFDWWMIQLDGTILDRKYERVQKLHRIKTMTKLFRYWYKLSLLNDMITWKNSKQSFQYWRRMSQIWHFQHLRVYLGKRFYKRKYAKCFFSKLRAAISRRIANITDNRLSNTMVLGQLSSFHNYNTSSIDWFSASMTRRSKLRTNQLSSTMNAQTFPLSNKAYGFELQVLDKSRLFRVWKRFADIKILRKRSKLIKISFFNWKQYSFSTKFLRQAFMYRIELFLRRYCLANGFALLYSLFRSRKCGQYVLMRRQQELIKLKFHFWIKLFNSRVFARQKVQVLVGHLYKKVLPFYFFSWKIKATCGRRLGVLAIKQRGMKEWKNFYIATRYNRILQLMRVFRAWGDLISTRKSNIQLFRERRNFLFEICNRYRKIEYKSMKTTIVEWQGSDSDNVY